MRTFLGPYRLEQVIGRGGMGIVYRARHRDDGRVVALKSLAATSPDAIASIRREVHTLSRLEHPGIVRVVQDGLASTPPWYAMELVEGPTVRAFSLAASGELPTTPDGGTASALAPTQADPRTTPEIARQTIEPGELIRVLSLVHRLCGTLAYLHGEGVVHRDLKPDNVIVRDGLPVLLDFGLTGRFGAAESRESPAAAGESSGTVWYVAPEQARGEPVDARADLYALGCLVHEILTGRPPFVGGAPADILWRHAHEAPVPPSQLVAGVPRELDDLLARLLAKDPRHRLAHADDVARALVDLGAEDGGPWGPPPKPYLCRAVMLGRDTEREKLRKRLARAAGGSGGVILVSGESGVGKTRLALQAMELARSHSMRTLASDIPDAGAHAPLAALRPLLQAIADRCREGGRAVTRSLLAAAGPGHVAAGAVLASHEPALRTVPGAEELPAPADLPPDAARRRVLRCVVDVARSYARDRPFLLLLDDLQWADDLTLAAVSLLADRLDDVPALVLGTYRSEESTATLAALQSSPRVETLPLRRLPAEAVDDIVRDALSNPAPPPSLLADVRLRAEGNPFFVGEYLRAAVGAGLLGRDADGRWHVIAGGAPDAPLGALGLPGTIQELVERRLAMLAAPARRFVAVMAVLGREVAGAVARQVAGAPEDDVLEALGELVRRQVLEEISADRYRFAHAKLREAVLAATPPADRVVLHRAAAEVLAASGAPPGEIAVHREHAGELAEARKLYLAAGNDAARQLAYGEAEALYAKVVALGDRPDAARVEALRRRGDMLRIVGRIEEARGQASQAVDEARGLGAAPEVAACLFDLAATLHVAGDMATALACLGEAEAIHAAGGDDVARGRCLREICANLQQTTRLAEAESVGSEALRIARQRGDLAEVAAVLGHLGHVSRVAGRYDEARDRYGECLAIATALGKPLAIALARGNLATLDLDQSRLAEAERGWREALPIVTALGHRRLEATMIGNLGSIASHRGDFEQSAALTREVLAIFEEMGDRRNQSIALGVLADIDYGMGRREACTALYRQAVSLARSVGDRTLVAIHLQNLALNLCKSGDLQAAHESIRSAMEIFEETGSPKGRGLAQGTLSLLLETEGRMEEARAAARVGIALLKDADTRRGECQVVLQLAKLERLAFGDLEEASRLVGAAISRLEGTGETDTLVHALTETVHVAIARGLDPTEPLARARKEATGLAATAPARDALRVAEAAAGAEARGVTLVRGSAPDDIAEPMRRWLGLLP